jgi:hypothetical protein
MSTLDAEFIACLEASRETKWSLQLLKDIHGKDLPPLPTNCDSQGALTFITTGIIKVRTKHIDVCYHNSVYLHKPRIVNYSYVQTDEKVADILTKALTKDKHTKFTKTMGLWYLEVDLRLYLRLLYFWKYRFLCLYGWPSSVYSSTLSLLTGHTGF